MPHFRRTYSRAFDRKMMANARKEDARRRREEKAKEPGKWKLIDNSSHAIHPFTSEKKLRDFAKAQGIIIKRSPTDPFAFYTDSFVFVPSNL